jgi:hypothetical protein
MIEEGKPAPTFTLPSDSGVRMTDTTIPVVEP